MECNSTSFVLGVLLVQFNLKVIVISSRFSPRRGCFARKLHVVQLLLVPAILAFKGANLRHSLKGLALGFGLDGPFFFWKVVDIM